MCITCRTDDSATPIFVALYYIINGLLSWGAAIDFLPAVVTCCTSVFDYVCVSVVHYMNDL